MTAVIYTHAHIDHFGGVLGVVEPDTTVPIIGSFGGTGHERLVTETHSGI